MAAITIRVRRSEVVVVPHVAIRAGDNFSGRSQLVRACQRPARGRVVKHNISPQRRVVTRRAIPRSKRRARGRVRGIIGLLPGRQVALGIPAIRRLNLQIVVVVDVAVRASSHLARRR